MRLSISTTQGFMYGVAAGLIAAIAMLYLILWPDCFRV